MHFFTKVKKKLNFKEKFLSLLFFYTFLKINYKGYQGCLWA